MQQFYVDTNSFITAWHILYPPSVLSSLWDQLAEKKPQLAIIKPIFDEIEKPISSEHFTTHPERYQVRGWLIENEFVVQEVSDEVEALSLDLEMKYEVTDVSAGANQNDITLIASSKVNGGIVVTYEKDQTQRPKNKDKYRIPIICKDEGVECLTFIQMLQRLNIQI
ncbi:MAG: DUF4411 family protein [Bacteroidales bacterium]|jgi:hypothetical protein|nr:DUF4411 family protein [Bacteroidales bacterium]